MPLIPPTAEKSRIQSAGQRPPRQRASLAQTRTANRPQQPDQTDTTDNAEIRGNSSPRQSVQRT